MIKYYRQLRKSLLAEHQTGKASSPTGRYVKYAIGEIILVVIGILIALQINNWNENRKSEKQEITYYCKIAEDLQIDIVNIDSSLVTINNRLESTQRLLTNLLKIQNDKEVLINDFIGTIRSYKFIPTRAAIQDITASGKLEVLTNQDLKNKILNHYNQQDNALNIININTEKLIDRVFTIENFADFGFQEVPQYRKFFKEELQYLLTSTEWQQNPNGHIYQNIKDMMILNVIQLNREIELLNQIQKDAKNLYDLLTEYCQ